MDLDGTITVGVWYYLIQEHKMGAIHTAVQADILKESNRLGLNILSEQWVRKGSGKYYGRPDLLNSKTGEVWEIKHGKVMGSPMAVARVVEAQAQASKYLGAETSNHIPVVQLGAAGAFSNTIPFARGEYIYEIYYETPAPGAVLYYVVGCKKNPNYLYDYDTKYKTNDKTLSSGYYASSGMAAISTAVSMAGGAVIGIGIGMMGQRGGFWTQEFL